MTNETNPLAGSIPMKNDHSFDDNRAKAGELVQFCEKDGAWEDVHYIGPDRVRGGHFVQFFDGSSLSTQALRMKPMPVKKWVLEFDSAKHAEDVITELRNIGWSEADIPYIQEVEVPPAP